MTTLTPVHLLVHYIADEEVVTAADVSAYFDVPAETAVEELNRLTSLGVLDEDEHTYEISAAHGGDPDDALEAYEKSSAPAPSVEAAPVVEAVPAPAPEPAPALVDSARITALEERVAKLEVLVAKLSASDVQVNPVIPPIEIPYRAKAPRAAAPKKKKQAAAPLAPGRKRATKKRLPAMVAEGLVPAGSAVSISLVSGAKATATIIDGKHVDSAGQKIRITDWAKAVTGWSVVNIYANVRVADGRTLEEVRSA